MIAPIDDISRSVAVCVVSKRAQRAVCEQEFQVVEAGAQPGLLDVTAQAYWPAVILSASEKP